MGRSMAGGESRGTFTQNSTRENVKTWKRKRDSDAVDPHRSIEIGVITLGTFTTTTTRGLVPCRKKGFPKVSRDEQSLKIVPEAALVPKHPFFIKLEPGFEPSDAFLIPTCEPYSTL